MLDYFGVSIIHGTLIFSTRSLTGVCNIFAYAYDYYHEGCLAPEGRPGMSEVFLLSGISGLSFDSDVLSLLSFSVLSPCSFRLVIMLLMDYSPDFFSRQFSNIFL